MNTFLFATNNLHKLNEIRSMAGSRFVVWGLKDVHFTGEIPEKELTLEGNAMGKARYLYHRMILNHSVQHLITGIFADDTGLEVEALHGAPGVFSARYSGDHFPSEQERSASNVRKLLQEMKDTRNRKARFRTVIAYISKEEEKLFEGIVNGHIIETPRGNNGFGYDPVFVPEGYTKTFAEMTEEEKNSISHRAKAFQQFLSYLYDKILLP